MKRRKAILYIRVSTDEQADKGHSLAHQEEMLRRYCLQNNIEVVGFYREDHSAKTFKRPEFTKMLEWLRKNKASADLLLFLKWDRFSRNAPDAYAMIGKLYKAGIEPQAIEQPLNLEIPEQKFLLALYLTAPEVENDRRALNVLAGIRKAMKLGRYMGSAPYGYIHTRTADNKPCISPDPQKAALVLEAFELIATAKYTIEELRKIMTTKGMKLSRNAFWCILRNPAYIGKVIVPAYKDECAEIKPGLHEPIVSEVLFYKVADVLEGRKRNKPASPFCQRAELPLRGFLTCGLCGKPLTGSASKGRNARYYYYHCKEGCKERFRAEEANEAFNRLLESVSCNKKLIKSYEAVMLDSTREAGRQKTAELTQAKKEQEILLTRLEKAQNLMLDGELTSTDYHNIKAKLEPELAKINARIGSLSSKKYDDQEIIAFGFEALHNLHKLFTGADLDGKRYFLGSTFPEKLIFQNKQYRTAENDNVLMLIAAAGKDLSIKKESSRDISQLLSCQVARTGIEPVIPP